MSEERDLGENGPAGGGEAGMAAPLQEDRAPRAEAGPAPQAEAAPQGVVQGRPAAFLFDVFGTLVDWHAGVSTIVGDAFAAKGVDLDPIAFAESWRRAYQPAMAPIRDGTRAYVPLDDLHRENLEALLEAHGLAAAFDPVETAQLARAWESLPPWPDVHAGLRRLKALAPVAPCSNGSIALMTHLARFADLPWDCILGAEIAGSYKPAPVVYMASCAALRIAPSQAVMVACHPDDLEAAAAAGLRTAYVPRPMEWGEAEVHAPLSLPDAAERFDHAAPDLEALAAQFED